MTALDVEVVDIRKVTTGSKIRALASVKFGEGVIVKGFVVGEGPNGIFAGLPRQLGKDGKWYDAITFLDEALGRRCKDKVLEAYDRETDGVEN